MSPRTRQPVASSPIEEVTVTEYVSVTVTWANGPPPLHVIAYCFYTGGTGCHEIDGSAELAIPRCENVGAYTIEGGDPVLVDHGVVRIWQASETVGQNLP